MVRHNRRLARALVALGMMAGTMAAGAAHSEPRVSTVNDADRAAAVEARRAGHRVEIVGRRTERGETYANPDGTFTRVEHTTTVRVRRGSTWVPADATLRRGRDGLIRPEATLTPMAFSGGGSTPLAQEGTSTTGVSLSWPARLPVPMVSGAAMTYPNVFPGVDLRIAVDAEGYSSTLVVRTDKAAANPALRRITLAVRTRGTRMAANGAGGALVLDRSGTTTFRVGAGSVHDSAADGSGGRGRGKIRMATVPGALTVTTDPSALGSSGTVFPVYMDVGTGRSVWHWTMMDSAAPNQSYWDDDRDDCPPAWKGRTLCPKVGHAFGDDDVYRSMFDFDTSTLARKHVISAVFSIDDIWSPDNTDHPIEAWWVNPIGPSTTWNNFVNGGFQFYQSTASSHAYDQQARRMEFSVLNAMQGVSSRAGGALTLGLKAPDENNQYQWKKFDATSGNLSVTYNSYPALPDQLSTNYRSCANPWIGTTTPTLRTHVADADGTAQSLTATFAWGEAAPFGGWTPLGSGSVPNVPPGTTTQFTIPAGQLTDGGTYAWWAKTNDGRDDSWDPTNPDAHDSGYCVFRVDATPPNTPKAVSSTDYPDDPDAWHGQVGQAGSFTFTPPDAAPDDVVSYVYGTSPSPSADLTVPADPTGHAATVHYTPDHEGDNFLYVWAKDKAGTLSLSNLTYRFGVNPGAGPVGAWKLDEGTGTIAADSAHGSTHPLTVSGAAWAPGRSGTGLRFAGAAAQAASDGPVLTTDQNYTVSAWARLTDRTASRTIASQDGTVNSGPSLGYDANDDRWTFGTAGNDTTGAATVRADSALAPQTGVWTHLVGEYDAVAHELRLYVNGVLEGKAAFSSAWNAGGPLVLGSRLSNGSRTGYWNGDLDDVRVWDRDLNASEVLFAYAANPTLAQIPVSRASGSAPCTPTETPDKAVDGVVDATSKWCSKDANPWLQLDLSAARTLTEVVVRHAQAGGEAAGYNTRDFDVQTSANGTTWTTVLSVRDNTEPVSRLSLPAPVTAAFVRVNVLTPTQTTDAAARIDEVEVYGVDTSLVNVAGGRPVTAAPDTPCSPAEDRGNATDLSLLTKWCAMRPAGGDLYLQVDLGQQTRVSWITLLNAQAGGEAAGYNTRDYDLQLSTDGTAWTPVELTRRNVAGTSGHALLPTYTARYVRVIFINPTQAAEQTARIYELQVYATG